SEAVSFAWYPVIGACELWGSIAGGRVGFVTPTFVTAGGPGCGTPGGTRLSLPSAVAGAPNAGPGWTPGGAARQCSAWSTGARPRRQRRLDRGRPAQVRLGQVVRRVGRPVAAGEEHQHLQLAVAQEADAREAVAADDVERLPALVLVAAEVEQDPGRVAHAPP